MSEKLSIVAKVTPVHVADDAVGVCGDETVDLEMAREMVFEVVGEEYTRP